MITHKILLIAALVAIPVGTMAVEASVQEVYDKLSNVDAEVLRTWMYGKSNASRVFRNVLKHNEHVVFSPAYAHDSKQSNDIVINMDVRLENVHWLSPYNLKGVLAYRALYVQEGPNFLRARKIVKDTELSAFTKCYAPTADDRMKCIMTIPRVAWPALKQLVAQEHEILMKKEQASE